MTYKKLTTYELQNEVYQLAKAKTSRYLYLHKKVLISISGGADSDVMLDLIQRVLNEKAYPYDCEIHYVFFDTGIEYKATKRHLDYLEEKYNISIERIKSKVPVPLGCQKFGLPFISKDISDKIACLQNHNFDFKTDGEKSYDELIKKYPTIKSRILWWCNKKKKHNIKDNYLLKEFLIEYPPNFKISAKCCYGAKKHPSTEYEKNNLIDLKMLGLRKDESGIRATKFHSCFTEGNYMDNFRPIFWFTDKDKKEYCDFYEIVHSDCYTVYGFKRTGCAGCPFNSNFEKDLEVIQKYEPQLYKAINNIFGKSYDYTRKYKLFKKGLENQIKIEI